MAVDVRRYERIKRQAEEAQSEADRAAGAYEQAMLTLRDEFKCNSLQEAEALAKKLEQQLNAAEEDYNVALDEFEQKHGNRLRAETSPRPAQGQAAVETGPTRSRR